MATPSADDEALPNRSTSQSGQPNGDQMPVDSPQPQTPTAPQLEEELNRLFQMQPSPEILDKLLQCGQQSVDIAEEFLELNNHEQALHFLDRARDAGMQCKQSAATSTLLASVHNHLAGMHYDRGDYDEGCEAAKEAIALLAGLPQAHSERRRAERMRILCQLELVAAAATLKAQRDDPAALQRQCENMRQLLYELKQLNADASSADSEDVLHDLITEQGLCLRHALPAEEQLERIEELLQQLWDTDKDANQHAIEILQARTILGAAHLSLSKQHNDPLAQLQKSEASLCRAMQVSLAYQEVFSPDEERDELLALLHYQQQIWQLLQDCYSRQYEELLQKAKPHAGSPSALELEREAEIAAGAALLVAESSKARLLLRSMEQREDGTIDNVGAFEDDPDRAQLDVTEALEGTGVAAVLEYTLLQHNNLVLIWMLTPGEKQMHHYRVSLEPYVGSGKKHPSMADLVESTLKRFSSVTGVRHAPPAQTMEEGLREDLGILADVLLGNVSWKLLDLPYDALVLLVPHGCLARAPFAALPWPRQVLDNAHGTRHVSEHLSMTFAPSIRSLRCCKQSLERLRTSFNWHGCCIVGNPSGDLRSAATEAQAVAEILTQLSGVMVKVQETGQAKEATMGVMTDASLIHVSGHAQSRDEEDVEELVPFLGCLELGSSNNRNLLAAREILRRWAPHGRESLKAWLIVLACCSSGYGSVADEGMLGLPWAFMLAGSLCTVVSMWDVSDNATGTLMQAFYTALSTGATVSQALREAMLETKKSFPHPAYWAAFSPYGLGSVSLPAAAQCSQEAAASIGDDRQRVLIRPAAGFVNGIKKFVCGKKSHIVIKNYKAEPLVGQLLTEIKLKIEGDDQLNVGASVATGGNVLVKHAGKYQYTDSVAELPVASATVGPGNVPIPGRLTPYVGSEGLLSLAIVEETPKHGWFSSPQKRYLLLGARVRLTARSGITIEANDRAIRTLTEDQWLALHHH